MTMEAMDEEVLLGMTMAELGGRAGGKGEGFFGVGGEGKDGGLSVPPPNVVLDVRLQAPLRMSAAHLLTLRLCSDDLDWLRDGSMVHPAGSGPFISSLCPHIFISFFLAP